MEKEFDKPVYSKHVIEMLTIANEYCHIMENAENHSKKTLTDLLQKIIPMLYIKGIFTPTVLPEDQSYNQKFVNEMLWERIFRVLKNKFEDDDKFWVIENTGINEFEPQPASMADMLTDIYQDLKDFILLYQQPDEFSKENAVADLKKYFQNHWGERCLKISTRLHQLVYQPDKNPFEENNFLEG